MQRFLSGFLAFLVALGLVVLLVSNRQTAIFSLDPTSADAPALAFGPWPVAIHIVVGLGIGFVLGAVGMWSSGAKRRAELRQRKREIARLEAELREARQGLYRAEPTGSALVPAGGPRDGRTDVLTVHG